ncbi:MAG: hypothetical protein MJE68_19255 [Proteobacteria bacterium]|nr:hypothetical protein [Pseudomonadota bacterium]
MAKLDQNHEKQKELTYYQTLLSAFVESRLEYVRRILTLSVLAIGFLASFLAIFRDEIANPWFMLIPFVPWLVANFAFIRALILALDIFLKDDQYVLKILQDQNADEKALENYRKSLYNEKRVIARFFLTGIICAIVFVVLYGMVFFLIR